MSAIYYPLNMLPHWLQVISKCLPMTYVFEVMRGVLTGKPTPASYVSISFALDFIYLALSLLFFWYMFTLSKEKGLARLE